MEVKVDEDDVMVLADCWPVSQIHPVEYVLSINLTEFQKSLYRKYLTICANRNGHVGTAQKGTTLHKDEQILRNIGNHPYVLGMARAVEGEDGEAWWWSDFQRYAKNKG